MKNKAFFVVFILSFLFVSHFALASWWNPFSWSIWHKKEIPIVVNVPIAPDSIPVPIVVKEQEIVPNKLVVIPAKTISIEPKIGQIDVVGITKGNIINSYNSLLSAIDSNIPGFRTMQYILNSDIVHYQDQIERNNKISEINPNSKATEDNFNAMYQSKINLDIGFIKIMDDSITWLVDTKGYINQYITNISQAKTIEEINTYDYLQFYSDNLKRLVSDAVTAMNNSDKENQKLNNYITDYNDYIRSLPVPRFTNCYYNNYGYSGTMNCTSY